MGATNQKQQKIAISGEIDHTVIKDRHFNDKYIMTPIEIGRGANAIVMMATCKTNNKVVVVKKIKNDKSERTRQLIKKECDISMSLKHPHILEFYDYFENEDETYLVCEYCQGGELYDLIRDTKIRTKRGITEELARVYLAQIISAVEYLHCNMIAHRDLKPENILLDKDKKCVKLCDFGMAAIVNSENYVNRRYSCCGSPGYFAPEIMKDYYQPLTSEVWSLGIVLYSMLAGEMPFGSGEDYIAKMREEQTIYLCPSYFSSDVKNLLSKMLIFNPKMRISLSKLKEHPWMMGSALPQKKYPALKLIEVWKLKYMVHLGYNADEIYKAVIENKRDSMFVAMYHNLKPVHVPEALRSSFNMVNSEISHDEENKWKKIDKKSKSDPQYSFGEAKGDRGGENKGEGKSEGKGEPKSEGKSERKSEIKSEAKSEGKGEAKSDAKSEIKNNAKNEHEKLNMKSSLANFSLIKPEPKKDPPKVNQVSKKNHSFLDNIVGNFIQTGSDDQNKRSSSDNTEPIFDESRRSSMMCASASFDNLQGIDSEEFVSKNSYKNITQLDESVPEVVKPIRTSKSPVLAVPPFVNINSNRKRSSSPFMTSPLHSPAQSPLHSPILSPAKSPPSSHLTSQENSPLHSPLHSKKQKNVIKSANNSPNRFQRFESITRRASDIFRSKKKTEEETIPPMSNSADSVKVSSMIVQPIDKLLQK